MKSRTIGIREAKAQLSRLVSEAERGAEWIITDRGRPVAKLTPVHDLRSPVEQRVRRLERWGWIEPAARPLRIPPALRIGADAQRVLQHDRGDLCPRPVIYWGRLSHPFGAHPRRPQHTGTRGGAPDADRAFHQRTRSVLRRGLRPPLVELC